MKVSIRDLTHARYCPKCGGEWFCACPRSRRHQRRCASCAAPSIIRPLAAVLEASEELKERAIKEHRYEDAATIRDLRMWIKRLSAANAKR